MTDAMADAAARAWADRVGDYRDIYNSRWDNIGNRIASALGFNEMAPSFDPHNLSGNADWGFDPVGGLAGLAGSAFGGPLGGFVAGRVANTLSGWAGRPLEVNLGPNVLGRASAGAAPASGKVRPNEHRSPRGAFQAYAEDPRMILARQQLMKSAQSRARGRPWIQRKAIQSQIDIPATMISADVPGLPAYGTVVPRYAAPLPRAGKSSGYGGTARPAPVTLPIPTI
jgi:hypothetical protein